MTRPGADGRMVGIRPSVARERNALRKVSPASMAAGRAAEMLAELDWWGIPRPRDAAEAERTKREVLDRLEQAAGSPGDSPLRAAGFELLGWWVEQGNVVTATIETDTAHDSYTVEFLSAQLTRIDHGLDEDAARAAAYAIARAWCAPPFAPPLHFAETYMARRGAWRLPVLTGIATTPTMRADGSVVSADGYDSASGLIIDTQGVAFPAVAEAPSRNEGRAALDALIEVVSEFPFVSDDEGGAPGGDQPSQSRSAALAMIVTAVARPMFSAAPMFGISAPTMATGKSLLADVPAMIVTGRRATKMSQGASEEEDEKRLLSVLTQGELDRAPAGDPPAGGGAGLRAGGGRAARVTDAADREALAARVLNEARARAAGTDNPGARVVLLRAAEARAERARAGLPVDMSYLRPASAPGRGAGPRSPTVPRDLRNADGTAKPSVVRPCLRCRSPFDSHGPGNRMCPVCRSKSAEASPYAV